MVSIRMVFGALIVPAQCLICNSVCQGRGRVFIRNCASSSRFTSSVNDDSALSFDKKPIHQMNTCIRYDASNAFPTSLYRIVKKLSLKVGEDVPILSDEDIVDNSSIAHCLTVTPFGEGNDDYRIGLVHLNEDSNNKKKRYKLLQRSKPFIVDWSSKSEVGKRLKALATSSSKELLLKAIGQKEKDQYIFDLTAGFGRDSAIIAMSNSVRQVVMIERDPIVSSLLEDGLRRVELSSTLQSSCNMEKTLATKLQFMHGEGINILQSLEQFELSRPNVCYLDPMFPQRTKSGKVKKNMQILHSLLDTNSDSGEEARASLEETLLEIALNVATKRVVVKRPINANVIRSSVVPNFDVTGSVNRWDIYLK